jgi:hypothetical protein
VRSKTTQHSQLICLLRVDEGPTDFDVLGERKWGPSSLSGWQISRIPKLEQRQRRTDIDTNVQPSRILRLYPLYGI